MSVIVITRGSRGIGGSAAEHIARRGMGVIPTHNTELQAADTVVERIERVGGKAVALKPDVSDASRAGSRCSPDTWPKNSASGAYWPMRYHPAPSAPNWNGKDGLPGHPDLKDFGANGRMLFWLREGVVEGRAVHVGFVASSQADVDAAYTAALHQRAVDNGPPGACLHYDPEYYAANMLGPDGYSLEFVYKKWQHVQ